MLIFKHSKEFIAKNIAPVIGFRLNVAFFFYLYWTYFGWFSLTFSLFTNFYIWCISKCIRIVKTFSWFFVSKIISRKKIFSSKTMNVLINRIIRLDDFYAFQKSLNEEKHCFFFIENDKIDIDWHFARLYYKTIWAS